VRLPGGGDTKQEIQWTWQVHLMLTPVQTTHPSHRHFRTGWLRANNSGASSRENSGLFGFFLVDFAYFNESPPTDTAVQCDSSPSSVRSLIQR